MQYSVKSGSDFQGRLIQTVNQGKNLGKCCKAYSRDKCEITCACFSEKKKKKKHEIYEDNCLCSVGETKYVSIYLPGTSDISMLSHRMNYQCHCMARV